MRVLLLEDHTSLLELVANASKNESNNFGMWYHSLYGIISHAPSDFFVLFYSSHIFISHP
jgi:hypothetical protein